jgi:hypothetical protein
MVELVVSMVVHQVHAFPHLVEFAVPAVPVFVPLHTLQLQFEHFNYFFHDIIYGYLAYPSSIYWFCHRD